MTANSLHASIGGLSLPLADAAHETGESLEPARDILLELLTAAINDELGQRWKSVISAGICSLINTDPVVTQCPLEPDEQLLQSTEVKFPALFVYRDERGKWESNDGDGRLGWPFRIDYVLGPLTAGDRRKLQDFLVAAVKVMIMTIERGGHLAYAAQSGHLTQPKLVLGHGGSAGLEGVKIAETSWGAASFSKDGAKYWAASLTIECYEDLEPGDSDPRDTPYDGVDASLGTGTGIAEDDPEPDPDEKTGVIDPLVEAETDLIA
jgi:hypothetical protein